MKVIDLKTNALSNNSSNKNRPCIPPRDYISMKDWEKVIEKDNRFIISKKVKCYI